MTGRRLALLALALAAAVGPASAQGGADELLRRDDERHGTLGPSGPRAHAVQLETALGLRGRFGYAEPLEAFADPVVLTLREQGRPLDPTLVHAVWRPSHTELAWQVEGLTVVERKLITADDQLVDRVILRNDSTGPRDIELLLEGRATPLVDRLRSRQQSVPLPGPADPDLLDGNGWPGGALDYDGLSYRLPGPGEPLVAVGSDGRLPAEVLVPLPPTRPARCVLHLLGTWLSGDGDRVAARYRLHLDDGSSEDRAWPLGPGEAPPGAGWMRLALPGGGRPALQCSYTPPPGRFVEAVSLLAGEGDARPALLAATLEFLPELGRMPVLLGRLDARGLDVHLALAGEGFVLAPEARALSRLVTLEPGAETGLQLVLATDQQPFAGALAALAAAEDGSLWARHLADGERWFGEQAPALACSDPRLERAWAYRWWLVRQLTRRLDRPGFSLPVVFDGNADGRHAQVGVTNAAAVLDEVRWLADHATAQGQVRTLLQHRTPAGLLRTVRLDGTGGCATQRIAAAAVGAWAVHGDEQFLREILPLLGEELQAFATRFDADGDGLPAPPAPWYASWTPGPDGASAAPGLATPAAAAWSFESARALAAAWSALGATERALPLERRAATIRAAALDRLWDGGYLTLDGAGKPVGAGGGAAALLPFVVGLDTDPGRFGQALARPLDAASAAWPGPDADCDESHPQHAALAALAAEATAVAVRAGRLPAAAFADRLAALTDLQFEDGGPAVRACRSADGRPQGCRDGFHGAYNDLLVRHVAGLQPRVDGRLELSPIDVGLESFRFRRLPHRGRQVEVVWDRPDGRAVWDDRPEGYSLLVDGVLVVTLPGLQPLLLD